MRSLVPWALAALLLAIVLFATRGLNLAIDFTGGMAVIVRAPASLALVQDALVEAAVNDVYLKRDAEQPADTFILVSQGEDWHAPQSGSPLKPKFASALKKRHVEVDQIEIITPSVGRELLQVGAIPPILAFAIAVIYSAFRHGRRYLRFAVAAILGTMVIVLALAFSAYLVFQWEFSLISLLAVDGLAIMAAVFGAALLPGVRPPDQSERQAIHQVRKIPSLERTR